MSLAEQIDALLDEQVLLFGSPPPAGRDLDLLARAPQADVLAAWLAGEGFLEDHDEWARFRACSVESLDLVRAESLGIEHARVDGLFAEAKPLEPFRRLVRPAPHHLLLLLARNAVESSGHLTPKRRERVERALAEDPDAWPRAEAEAPAWRAVRSLAALRRACETAAPLPLRARAEGLAEWLYAPGRTPHRALARAWVDVLRRRGEPARLISFSGLDGAGKSAQAEALRETLSQLGYETELQWVRLEWTTLWENRWLGVIGWPARAALGALARTRGRRAAAGGNGSGPAPPLEPAAVRERSELISQVWVTIVALTHALAQRGETRRHLGPGKVVISDRYTLDAAAHLRFRYGEHRAFRFQIRLLEALSPRPAQAYFIDIPAETAYARKAEQYSLADLARQAELYRAECDRLGARRLDGERPRAELCAEIAVEVWRALRG